MIDRPGSFCLDNCDRSDWADSVIMLLVLHHVVFHFSLQVSLARRGM